MNNYTISQRTAFYIGILDSIGNFESILCERISDTLDEDERREFLMDISTSFDNLVKCASDKVSESIRINLAALRYDEDTPKNCII